MIFMHFKRRKTKWQHKKYKNTYVIYIVKELSKKDNKAPMIFVGGISAEWEFGCLLVVVTGDAGSFLLCEIKGIWSMQIMYDGSMFHHSNEY